MHYHNPVEPGGPTIARVHDGDVHPRVTVEPCFDRLCRIAYPLCDAAHDIVAAGDLQPCGVATRAVVGVETAEVAGVFNAGLALKSSSLPPPYLLLIND